MTPVLSQINRQKIPTEKNMKTPTTPQEMEHRIKVLTKQRDHLKEQLTLAMEKLIEQQRIIDARNTQVEAA